MNHDKLIHALYAAASDAEAWSAMPMAICESFGGAAMVLADGYAGDFSSYRIVRHGYGDDLLADSGATIADNLDPEYNIGFRKCMTSRLSKSFDGRDIYLEAPAADRVFYERCFVRNRMAFLRPFTIVRDGDALAGGFMARPTSSGPLDPGDVERFDGVLSHLRRAADLKMKLEVGRAAQGALAAMVDRLYHAVFLVDRDLRVLVRNAAAEASVLQGDGVEMPKRRLRLADTDAQKVLLQRMARLYTTGFAAVETPVKMRRPSGLPPIAVSVYPTSGLGGPVGAHAAYACIVMSDPCAESSLPARERIEAALGLTPAEARVARLTPLALSSRRMAEHLGLAETTVKTHLASARGKLGVGKTSALARIVSRLGPR